MHGIEDHGVAGLRMLTIHLHHRLVRIVFPAEMCHEEDCLYGHQAGHEQDPLFPCHTGDRQDGRWIRDHEVMKGDHGRHAKTVKRN